jgi:hypothetical protein
MIETTNITIVTAGFSEVSKLLEEDYICVSIIGKVYGDYDRKEEIQRITSLNTFRHYYHIKAKDWYACNILYRDILNRKGIEKLKTDFDNLVKTNTKTKIALCDNSTGDEFGFRHILRHFLLENGVEVSDTAKVDISIQKDYWKLDQYKLQGHFNLTDDLVGNILEKSEWIFAKTLPKNPHFYVLRKNFGNNELFLKIISHIRFYGKPEIFEGVLYRVFYYNGYRYWDHPCDLLNEDCDLINRKLI